MRKKLLDYNSLMKNIILVDFLFQSAKEPTDIVLPGNGGWMKWFLRGFIPNGIVRTNQIKYSAL